MQFGQEAAVKKVWLLQDARNRFSEVIDRAASEGPQAIARRREVVAYIV
jgi:prevent-host-death family protein